MISLLTLMQFPQKKIVGTSASISCAISLLRVLCLLYKAHSTEANSYAGIHIAAFWGIVMGSLLSISYGVRLARTFSYSVISKIFATLMLTTGILMCIDG